MVNELTKSQLIAFKNLLETYKRYSENINYDIADVKVLAHPEVNDQIFFHAKLSGFKKGEIFSEERYTCVLENGSQSDCMTMFRLPEQRTEFINELVEVKINNQGKVVKK